MFRAGVWNLGQHGYSECPNYYRPAEVAADGIPLKSDLCIYTANAAGVAAAVEASRRGLRVVLLNPAWQVGGVTTGGLSFTDMGNHDAVCGLAREFYRELGAHYGVYEKWCFEPHVAERTLEAWLEKEGVVVQHGQYVAKAELRDDRIQKLTTTSGLRVKADYFIDCSYEGDLMAAAGVTHTSGREGNATYREKLNGQQIESAHQFQSAVDPYREEGNPESGLLPGIDSDDRFIPGVGDQRLQAYNFRICMTKDSTRRVPFAKPADYDRAEYELLARYLATGWDDVFRKFDRIRGGKTDTNNHGAISTDYIGANWDWPTGSYERREEIFQKHVTYTQGYLWFLANDPAVPEHLRAAFSEWGLASDEFTATGHWPHQLYIREGRRMVGDTVMTELHCMSREIVEDGVGLGAYGMDSHNCRRLVHAGMVLNEGDVQIKLPKPYAISYRSIVPPRGEVQNLVVPVAVSASHIAFGSIRMEPVFMILAQSAAIAVALCRQRDGLAVQDLSYAELRPELDHAGQIVAWDPEKMNPFNGNPESPTEG